MVSSVKGFGMQTSVGISGDPADRTGFFGQSAAAAAIGATASNQTLKIPRTVSKQ